MKHALLISYFWPPSVRASLQWQLHVANELLRHGIKTTVLTVSNESFETKDESFVSWVSPEIEVIYAPAWEPFGIYRKFTGKKANEKLVSSETITKTKKGIAHRLAIWIRMNLFIPDARIGWYRNAVKRAENFLKEHPVDIIYSMGPPHSSHLISRKLSKRLGIPYIVILQDPWTDIVYYKEFGRSCITKKIDESLERKTLRDSAAAVFVNHSTQADYIKKYPFLREKSHVLYWGYNEKAFEEIERSRANDGVLRIVHTGNIFDYQNPSAFWKTLRNKIGNGEKIELRFTGTVSPLIKQEIEMNGLLPHTRFLGVVSYSEMLTEIVNADILLVCPSEPRHVPGKLFEYFRSGVPILAFHDNNPEVQGLLEKSGAGMLLPVSDSGQIFFDRLSSLKPSFAFGKQFDRSDIATSFASIIELCLKGKQP